MVEQKINKIKEKVKEYVSRNAYLIPEDILYDVDSMEHIVDIGTSIMCTKWEVGYPGGGFVQAIVDNDLEGAVSRADMVCVRCLKFFVTLKLNLGYIE
jgi:hypothetical protein